jgi:hypothetical protein
MAAESAGFWAYSPNNLPIRYNRPFAAFVAAKAVQMPIPIVRKVIACKLELRRPS